MSSCTTTSSPGPRAKCFWPRATRVTRQQLHGVVRSVRSEYPALGLVAALREPTAAPRATTPLPRAPAGCNASQLDPDYLAKCQTRRSSPPATISCDAPRANAYGTAFDTPSKRSRVAGWYFSIDRAFDMAVAYQLNPHAGLFDGDPRPT